MRPRSDAAADRIHPGWTLAVSVGTELTRFPNTRAERGREGEVYRAEDTRFGSVMALEVLLEVFGADPERLLGGHVTRPGVPDRPGPTAHRPWARRVGPSLSAPW